VDFSGVERYIDTPAKRYSSGMTVRLGFAIAAHLDPEILVVDEVLAVGDAEFQDKAIGKMQDVSKGEGRTVLFVSHNMAAVKNLCTKGLVLKNGLIDFTGTAVDAIGSYLNFDMDNSQKRIVETIKYNNDKIKINEVNINDSPFKQLSITEKQGINLQIKGALKVETKISLELKIFDQNEVPIIFFSTDHESGVTNIYPIGTFEILKKIELPKGLTKGRYYVDIHLTNPLVEGHVDMYKALIIDYEGHATTKGFVFEYSKGHGYIFSY
jgi:lipopolysaccharide transport system ATP-binding protein